MQKTLAGARFIRHQFRDLNINRRLRAMAFSVSVHSQSSIMVLGMGRLFQRIPRRVAQ
jgi:hypothetical protein